MFVLAVMISKVTCFSMTFMNPVVWTFAEWNNPSKVVFSDFKAVVDMSSLETV